MKKLALAIMALAGIYSVSAKTTANTYFVTVTPNGLRVLSQAPAGCFDGDNIVCQISTNGTYSVGQTIPPSVAHATLAKKP